MHMTCRSLKPSLFAALLLSACSGDPTEGNPDPGNRPEGPAEGEVVLYIDTEPLDMSDGELHMDLAENDAVIINGRTCYIKLDDNGKATVYAEEADDGIYEAIYPASLYSKSNETFTLPFAQFYKDEAPADQSMPAYGKCTEGKTIHLKPACGVLHLNISGTGNITSIRVADRSGESIAGIYEFDRGAGAIGDIAATAPYSEAVVLNCAGTSGSEANINAAGTDFYIVIPSGLYKDGFDVRISDRSHKFIECEFPTQYDIGTGEVVSLPTIAYEPDKDLLYAQHFDNCTWGGDIVGGRKGFGRGSSATDSAPSAATGTETALQVKSSTTAGTTFVTTTDYTDYTYESPALTLSQTFLRNRGLDDWRTLFYATEYHGYICGGDNAAHTNRGIIRTPHITALGYTPCMAEISFRLCLEKGFSGILEIQATNQGSGDKTISGSGTVFMEYLVDGESRDISPETSRRISQASATRTKILVNSAEIEPGIWHKITLKVGALSSNTTFRFFPTVIRSAPNIYYIDDFVVTRIPYGYENDYTIVEPTTEPGSPNEDVSRLRLRVGTTGSLTDNAAYTATRALGFSHISPGFGSKENAAQASAQWRGDAETYGKKARENGLKIWCMHLPYGSQNEERYYDLCAPDAEHRDSTVRYFSALIRAAEALEPAYLLIHCNQTLKDNDGSSAESLARSLYELQIVADEIGTQIAVENMSHGIGADIDVLAEAVDKANAMTTMGRVKKPIKIAFDIGHANIYLGIKKDGRTVADWLRAAGTRIGAVHMHDNRGTGVANRSYSDDHLDPGYSKDGALYRTDGKYGSIGARDMWGEIYYILLHDCLYRGVFDYESGTTSFGEVASLSGETESRYDQIKSPWHAAHNYDTYVYPAFRKFCGKQ